MSRASSLTRKLHNGVLHTGWGIANMHSKLTAFVTRRAETVPAAVSHAGRRSGASPGTGKEEWA